VTGELTATEGLRQRIRRAIEERERWERDRRTFELTRASLVARMFDGFALAFLYVLGVGFLIGYATEADQVARNWLAILALTAWVTGRAIKQDAQARNR
jgi:hypothetical protein